MSQLTNSMDVQEYAAAWDAAENLFAANGAYRSALDESILTRGLNPVQREIAYDYGRGIYEAKKAELEKGREKTTPQPPAATAPLTRGAMERGKGSLSYEGGTVDGVTYKAVDRKKLTERQKSQAAVAEAMAEATGLDFVLYDGNARGTQGVYVPGGTIYLNINAGAAISKNLMVQAMAHELTHFIQENAESEYQELKDYVVRQLLLSGGGKLETLVLNKQKEWSGLSYSEALDEVVADGCEMMLKSSKAVQQLAAENRSLAGRIGQWVKDFVRRLKRAFKGVEARHEEARILMRNAEALQKMWDRALVQAVHSRDAQGSKTAATEGGSVKYSLMQFEDGRKFVEVQAQKEKFDGLSVKEQQTLAKKIILENFAQKVIGKTNRVFVNRTGAQEYAYPSKFITEDGIKEAKMRASSELDNLIEAGTNFRVSPDGMYGHVHPTAVGGFSYFDTLFKIGNEYFEGTVNILNNKKGALFKDITKIRNVTKDIISSYGANPKSEFLSDTSMDSIRNTDENVNTKYSLWDEGVSDRELLLDAATEENASEAVLAYARKYKAYEGLLRREERLRVRLEAARAAEQSKTGSDGPSGTPAPTSALDDGSTSSGPAGHLPLEGKALRETTPQSPAATAPLTRGAMERGKGSLSYEGGTVDGVTYKAVDRKKLNQKQKTQAAVAEAMAEATGLDFVLYDGDARGTQGVYVPGGTIYLNINAGAAINKGLMVQAMGHELTHFIQENAESEYQALKDFVVERLLRAGDGKFETLVLEKQNMRKNFAWGKTPGQGFLA